MTNLNPERPEKPQVQLRACIAINAVPRRNAVRQMMDGPLCCDLGAGRGDLCALGALGVRVARRSHVALARLRRSPQFISVFLIVRAVDVCDRLVSERMVPARVWIGPEPQVGGRNVALMWDRVTALGVLGGSALRFGCSAKFGASSLFL